MLTNTDSGVMPNGTTYTRRSPAVVVVTMPRSLVIINRVAFKVDVLALGETLQGPDARLILDATHTDYIDASGLGTLVSCASKLARRDRSVSLILAGVNAANRTLLEITKLDALLRVAPTVDAALPRRV